MSFDFGQIINRRNTDCAKWDEMDEKYQNTDIIHLGVADMDFSIPEQMKNAFVKVVEHGILGYTNISEKFYCTIQYFLKKQLGEVIPKEWIVYCPRINVAGSLLVNLFTKEQEGVMIHAPYYMPLYQAIDKNKRKVIESPLKWSGNRYVMDFDQMEEAVTKETKMLLLCSPHNPCTTIFTSKEVEKLSEFCVRHHLILVSDEIHSDIRHENAVFTSALHMNDALKQQLVYVNSPTKTFNIPGLLLSYMVIPNECIRNKVKQEIDRMGMHNPNVFANTAIQTAYCQCDDWLLECNRYINDNEKYVRNYIEKKLPEFKIMPREGTFLLWIDCRGTGLDDEQLEVWFIEKARVGVYMGSVFGTGGRGFVRMNIAASRSLLEQALLRMEQAQQYLKKQRR